MPSISETKTSASTQSRFWVEPTAHMSWQRFASTSGVEYPQHSHSEFNLVICLAGRVEVRQFGHVEIAEPGDVLVGNAAIPHQSVYRPVDGHCRAVSLTISNNLFREAADREADWRASEGNRLLACLGKLTSPHIHTVAKAVYAELKDAPRPNDQLLKAWGPSLLGETLRKWPREGRWQEKADGEIPRLPRWQFVQAHEWMLRSPKEAFAVKEVARRLGICTSRFHHLFRASAGLPPAQYFRNLLLQQASKRLIETSDQIKEISYEMGFRTPSHFCSVFRKHYGMSPLEYRVHAIGHQTPEQRDSLSE